MGQRCGKLLFKNYNLNYLSMIQNQRNYFWITNGVETKKLFSDEKVPEGWYKGRTFKKRNNVDG